MGRRVSIMIAGTLLVMGGWMPWAWATVDNLKVYKQAFPDKAAKASCKTCHEGAIGKKGDLNAYGLALQKLKGPGNALKLTEADIRAVPAANVAPASPDASAAPTGEE